MYVGAERSCVTSTSYARRCVLLKNWCSLGFFFGAFIASWYLEKYSPGPGGARLGATLTCGSRSTLVAKLLVCACSSVAATGAAGRLAVAVL